MLASSRDLLVLAATSSPFSAYHLSDVVHVLALDSRLFISSQQLTLPPLPSPSSPSHLLI